jgi:tRNA (mo5U34)-methyltransferase
LKGFDDAAGDLDAAGLADWTESLQGLYAQRMSSTHHGDYARWSALVGKLAALRSDPQALEQALLELAPWRKGPFDVAGVHIDAEWRSDRKWARVRGAIHDLAGRRVLDVGCGNGWYALKMREAGAGLVVGIDPTLLYVMQFLAIAELTDTTGVHVLPFRLEELPQGSRAFDTAFSMGVLYHQRSPLEHLRQLRGSLRSGGQLVLETLVLPGDDAFASTPPGRYAQMKNVWLLPTVPELLTWMRRTGFRDLQAVDVTRTTPDEQRQTRWMHFESLGDALDPEDPARTVEGWPAPLRAVVTAAAP